MATFCYLRKDDGKIFERHYPCGEAPDEIELEDGTTAERNIGIEQCNKAYRPGTGWPMECFASGVHPSQRGELADYLKKRGVPTEVSRDGNPIYRDAAHRRRALKERGYVDRSSYV